MNIVIAGGGTGGHLYPCLALAETWIQRFPKTEILFIGTRAGIEARVVPQKGFRFETIWAKGFIGKSFLEKIASLFHLLVGMMQAIAHLRRFAPSLVVGIGGYLAGPVFLAAFVLRIRRVLMEPNYVPGAMNALLAPWVDVAITAFHDTGTMLRARKVACLGVPVRSDILAAAAARRRSSGDRKTILVVGGSQGAHRMNQGIINALPFLEKQPIRIIHQTGERDFAWVQQAYAASTVEAQVLKFIDAMAEVYAMCDFVIGRAGAGTLSELAVMGLPALLVPFPHAQGHQEKNARPFVAAGAAEMILESEWVGYGGEQLARRILDLVTCSEKRSVMSEAARRLGHPHAASDIVSVCCELAEQYASEK